MLVWTIEPLPELLGREALDRAFGRPVMKTAAQKNTGATPRTTLFIYVNPSLLSRRAYPSPAKPTIMVHTSWAIGQDPSSK
jgi:hypothetical protein